MGEGHSSQSTQQPTQVTPPDDPVATLTGTALQRLGAALIAVAKRPSRAAYATWMRVVEPGWIAPLVVAVIGLGFVDSAISLGIRALLAPPSSTTIHYLFGEPSMRDQVVSWLLVNPLLGLLNLAVAIYLIAALIPAQQGSLNERALQVARPYLLSQMVISGVNIVIGEPLFALGLTAVGANPLANLLITVVNLAIGVYGLIASLNALAAGSGRRRLLIFGVVILAGSVIFLVAWVALGALLSVVGVHLPIPTP